MNPVYTAKGMVELEDLEIEDHIEIFDNCRKITTHYLLNGEVVRTDVAASMLRGPVDAQTVQGKLS